MMTVLQILLLAFAVLVLLAAIGLLVLFWAADATADWEQHKRGDSTPENLSDRVDKLVKSSGP
jgi:nitrogen fixation-related uncharacterized protein